MHPKGRWSINQGVRFGVGSSVHRAEQGAVVGESATRKRGESQRPPAHGKGHLHLPVGLCFLHFTVLAPCRRHQIRRLLFNVV